MKFTRHICSAMTLIVFALLFGGSASTKSATTVLIVPDFDFSPPSPVAPGSAGIKIGLLDPCISWKFCLFRQISFQRFSWKHGKRL